MICCCEEFFDGEHCCFYVTYCILQFLLLVTYSQKIKMSGLPKRSGNEDESTTPVDGSSGVSLGKLVSVKIFSIYFNIFFAACSSGVTHRR